MQQANRVIHLTRYCMTDWRHLAHTVSYWRSKRHYL